MQKEESLIFKMNKTKLIIMFLGSCIFVCIGILMIRDTQSEGWFGTFFFGLCALVFLIQLHPKSSYLKLDREGFEIKSLFRSNYTKWTDVKDFRKGHIKGSKMIFFDYTDKHKKWNNGKKVAKLLSGKEGALQSSYNISTDKLIKLMTEYKLKSKNVLQHGL